MSECHLECDAVVQGERLASHEQSAKCKYHVLIYPIQAGNTVFQTSRP